MANDTPLSPEPRRLVAPAIVFLGLWLVLMAGGRESFFRDAGTFWHVRTGEWILDSREFLDHDPYTFTHGGRPWTPYEWFAEVLMANLYRAAGLDGLLLAATAVLSLSFTLLLTRLLRSGLHWLPAAALVGLAVAASAAHFHARPHVLTILFFVVLVLRLIDFDAGRCRLRGLWWLLPLFVVWANTHGGVLGGYGTVVLAVTGWVTAWGIGWPGPVANRWAAIGLIAWAAVVLLTALATPYGTSLPETWLDIMAMTELPSIIKEHAPVDPTESSSWAFFLLGIVYLIMIAGLRQKPRVMWLLPIVWFVLGCDRVRHAPLFAVIAVAAIAEFFPATIWAKRLLTRPDLYSPPSGPVRTSRFAIAVCVAIVFSSFALQMARVRAPVVCAGWARLPETVWPVGIVPVLQREAGDRGEIPIFNEYEFGGFLIFFTPEYRPFVDDRCEVFGGPWLAEFVAAANGDASTAMAKWQAEYPGFDYALVRPESGFGRYFAKSKDWQLIAEVPAARFYKRIEPSQLE